METRKTHPLLTLCLSIGYMIDGAIAQPTELKSHQIEVHSVVVDLPTVVTLPPPSGEIWDMLQSSGQIPAPPSNAAGSSANGQHSDTDLVPSKRSKSQLAHCSQTEQARRLARFRDSHALAQSTKVGQARSHSQTSVPGRRLMMLGFIEYFAVGRRTTLCGPKPPGNVALFSRYHLAVGIGTPMELSPDIGSISSCHVGVDVILHSDADSIIDISTTR